jgi:hypothetical protein
MTISLRHMTAALFVLILNIPLSTSATQVEYLPVEALGSDSPVVVRGNVTDVRSYWNDARTRILTETTVRVSERYKGAPAGQLRIVQMGGEVDGVRMTVAGSLEWMPGEDVVLFLEDSLPGRYRVTGFSQGKFGVQADPQTGEEFVVQAGFSDVELVGAERGIAPARLSLDRLIARALPERQLGVE